jgi:hypothetical protein
MLTVVPAAPDLGLKALMLGAAVTVKETPLLDAPLIVTTTFPVVAPLGTVAVMLLELKAVMVAETSLKVTVALDSLDPKLLPAMTTAELTAPLLGVRLLMVGEAARACPAANTSVVTIIVIKTSRAFRILRLPRLRSFRDLQGRTYLG